ncbi:MAG TPA: AsnC family transcriptional regulator [Methanomassiliicoccales archaeon]|nr:AsnC family transcriptional regulator [Methanomassiliicoccales archaeon]
MDEMDLLIIKELAVDPRLPYSDLADRLSLSINGTHKRTQQLIAKGIIAGFRTRLSPLLTGGSTMELYGRSLSTDLSATMDQIGAHDCTARIIATGGQFLYVVGQVRSNEDIPTYQSFVRDVGKIDDLKTLGMFTAGEPPTKDPLSKLDYRIIRALSLDCRRPLQDVAAELGSTAKTVKRRLESMVSNRMVYYTIDLVLCSSGDLISIVHAKLRPDRQLKDVIPSMINRKDPHLLGISASNLEPNLMFFSIWASDLKELREVEKGLNENGDFDSLYSNLYYDMRLYQTWSEKLIAKRSA